MQLSLDVPRTRTILALCLLSVASLAAAPARAVTIVPTEDVMTSAFFSGTNQVRGYIGDTRPTFRVSSDLAFGVGPETVYLQFDAADFSSFTGPVASAVLTMESTDGLFGANAGPGSPFLVSAHGVNLDPFANITDDTSAGTLTPLDFFNNNILAAAAGATTSVDSFGPIQFDVTDLVNDWISGGNTLFYIAMTGKNDSTPGSGFLHGFRNNSDTLADEGFTFLTVTAVPEPGALWLLASVGLALRSWGRERSR